MHKGNLNRIKVKVENAERNLKNAGLWEDVNALIEELEPHLPDKPVEDVVKEASGG